jgi:hypothetical protein
MRSERSLAGAAVVYALLERLARYDAQVVVRT